MYIKSDSMHHFLGRMLQKYNSKLLNEMPNKLNILLQYKEKLLIIHDYWETKIERFSDQIHLKDLLHPVLRYLS